MVDRNVQHFYKEYPRMVSSPFGGVDGLNSQLLTDVLHNLAINVSGRKILDIGCGRGYAGDLVTELGGTYFGADFVCSRKGFRLSLADSAALPFRPATFDALFCVDAYEHFPESQASTNEFHRVLKPGGTVFLSVPNYSNVAGIVKVLSEAVGSYEKNSWAPFGRWQPQEHELCITPGKVRTFFRNAGFKRFTVLGYGREVGLGLFPWVEHPRMPEFLQYRLQAFFDAIGPTIARAWAGASLHTFWRIDRD